MIQNGFEYGVRHHLALSNGPMGHILMSEMGLSDSQILFLLNLGAIYHNHKRSDGPLDSQIQLNDYLRVHTNPRRFDCSKTKWKETIIFENVDFIVMNKPAGLPCHPTVDNKIENILTQASRALKTSLYITHRLDVPTSGLIVYAKTKEFQTRFNKLIMQGAVEKIYFAQVEKKNSSLKPGIIEHWMKKSPYAPKTVSSQPQPDWPGGGDLCQLEILETKEMNDSTNQLKIRLITGRTHQIRSQLSHLGFPIIGDQLYGSSRTHQAGLESIGLTAAILKLRIDNIDYQFSLDPQN
ncbi:MAG: hypothetical protein BroJett040_23090 [Oligoflexia bacterium]|nr:MAG: hypothetical protein BroJett040_23090 [Oligoflexia bacterium]